MSSSQFSELQRLPLRRTALVLAIPPAGMTMLLIWQVVLGHPWGKEPTSNANVIGWTVFLWAIYLRLITVRLATEVRDGELFIALRGFWRKRHVLLSEIQSVEVLRIQPERD